MEDATVKEMAEKLTELAKKYPNARLCLPDTKKGHTRFIDKNIIWSDEQLVCLTYNKRDQKAGVYACDVKIVQPVQKNIIPKVMKLIGIVNVELKTMIESKIKKDILAANCIIKSSKIIAKNLTQIMMKCQPMNIYEAATNLTRNEVKTWQK